MRGGQLDRYITISRPVAVDDPIYGMQPGGWAVFATPRIPAQVLDDLPSKSESTDGAVRIAARPARVRIRYLRGITSDMKVTLHDGENASGDIDFQIAGGPAEIGRREWTEFTVAAWSTNP